MRSDPGEDSRRWHLDKKVPISIIAALFVQFLGGVWFMSKLESRIVALETAKNAQERTDEAQDRRAGEALSLVRGDIQELSRMLHRLIERTAK